jgi:hypothetical protein
MTTTLWHQTPRIQLPLLSQLTSAQNFVVLLRSLDLRFMTMVLCGRAGAIFSVRTQ